MATPTTTHPYTYLSPTEAENPIQAILDSSQDYDLFDDRKALLNAFNNHLATQDEETEGLTKEELVDLSRRLCKIREAAHVLSSRSKKIEEIEFDTQRT
jgi:hypothetical protein